MAQTKPRSGSSRTSSRGSKSTKSSKSRSSNGSSARASSSSRSRSTGTSRSGNSSRSSAKRGGSSSSSRSRKQTQSSRKPQSRSSSQRNGQEKSTLESIASKAKGPAMAGGAALVGIAGGVALKNRQQKRRGLLSKVPTPKLKKPDVDLSKLKPSNVSLPKPDEALKAIGSAAGQVSEKSRKLGQVADDVQRASDAINNKR
jgi:hypothetical protein